PRFLAPSVAALRWRRWSLPARRMRRVATPQRRSRRRWRRWASRRGGRPGGARMDVMNEAQGPTPTGTSRPYRSLAEALRAHRIPEENHAFIGAVVDAVGIISFID